MNRNNPLQANMPLDHQQLREILPYSFPFVLIDRVIEYKEGESLTAIKNITANEWPFNQDIAQATHFPETLIIEAAAQAALILYKISKPQEINKESLFVLGRIQAEFQKEVKVGSQLQLKVSVGKVLKTGGYSNVTIFADAESVCEVQVIYGVKSKSGATL